VRRSSTLYADTQSTKRSIQLSLYLIISVYSCTQISLLFANSRVAFRSSSRPAAWWSLQEHKKADAQSTLALSCAWLCWIAVLLGGCLALQDASPWTYSAFVCSVFYSTKFIPDNGDIVWPYYLYLSLPLHARKGIMVRHVLKYVVQPPVADTSATWYSVQAQLSPSVKTTMSTAAC
jgi:hypothetical protein